MQFVARNWSAYNGFSVGSKYVFSTISVTSSEKSSEPSLLRVRFYFSPTSYDHTTVTQNSLQTTYTYTLTQTDTHAYTQTHTLTHRHTHRHARLHTHTQSSVSKAARS